MAPKLQSPTGPAPPLPRKSSKPRKVPDQGGSPLRDAYGNRSSIFVKYRRPTTGSHEEKAATPDEQGPVDFIQEEDGITLIAPAGDLVLDVRQDESSECYSYRVQASTLKQSSLYFDRLLGQTFREGIAVTNQLSELALSHDTVSQVRSASLPRVSIEHVGQISNKVKTIHPLVTDFLAILHGRDTTGRKVPLPNLANLCVVADRFDSLAVVTRWAHRKGMLRPSSAAVQLHSEETLRQRIYVGLLLDHHPWLVKHSAQLILAGSPRWSSEYDGRESDEPDSASTDEPPWNNLPRGVEDELFFRRSCILATLASLIEHYISLYASPSRQCKLGYDSSAQCDAFQLGQYIKFLAKKDMLSVRASFASLAHSDMDEQSNDRGHILTTLIQPLREMPSYQVDVNHWHCGPRKRLVAYLDIIEDMLAESSIGVCLDCIQSGLPGRPNESWSWQRMKRLPLVAAHLVRRKAGLDRKAEQHRHVLGCELFCANEWVWHEDVEA